MRSTERRALLALLAAVLTAAAVAADRQQAKQKAELAATLTGGDPSRAPPLMRRYGCAGCHTIAGIPGADGKVGPPLTAIIDRVYIGGGTPNTAQDLVRWLIDPQGFAVHGAMPPSGVGDAEARDIAAYLYAH